MSRPPLDGASAPPLPRYVRTRSADVHAVEYGSDPRLARQVRSWVRMASRIPEDQADSLVKVAHELYANALAHTASGFPHGLTRLVLTRHPAWLHVAATDQGPVPGYEPGFPQMATDPGETGNGLRLVDAVSLSWGWYGDQAGCTVWAKVARSTVSRRSLSAEAIRALAQPRAS